MIKCYHDDPLFDGHMVQKKMYEKLREKFNWKIMRRDVAKFARECSKCALNKPKNGFRVPMMITESPR